MAIAENLERGLFESDQALAWARLDIGRLLDLIDKMEAKKGGK